MSSEDSNSALQETLMLVASFLCAIITTVALTALSFLCSALLVELAGTISAEMRRPLGEAFGYVGVMLIPYTFLVQPFILTAMFQHACLSGALWTTLKSQRWAYLTLFLVGVVLWIALWYSGGLSA